MSVSQPSYPPPSPATRAKARSLLERGRVHPGFYVRGEHDTYHVTTDADADRGTATFIYCDCEHGKYHTCQARCSHALAVIAAIKEETPLPPLP